MFGFFMFNLFATLYKRWLFIAAFTAVIERNLPRYVFADCDSELARASFHEK